MSILLRRLTARAHAVVPAAPFHPLSRFVYAVGAVWMVVLTVYFNLSEFRLGYSLAYYAVGMFGYAVLSAVLARRYGMPRIATFIESVMVLPFIGTMMLASTAIMARHSSAFIDPLLRASDRALGFDWLQLLAVYQRHPGMMRSLDLAYASLLEQIIIVPVLTALFAGERKLWQLLTAWVLAYLVTISIFPFATAAGPMSGYGITPAMVPELTSTWQWQFAPLIAKLRSGEIMDMSQCILGIVQFPSFHAAAAVMLGWAGWQLRWWGAPLVVLNALMLFATLINGDHYLTDVLAGCAIAAISLWGAGRLIGWQAGRAAGGASPQPPIPAVS